MFSYRFLPKDEILVGIHHHIDALEDGKVVHCVNIPCFELSSEGALP
jgi:hypothetical protein